MTHQVVGTAEHRVTVRDGAAVAGVQALIERRLEVYTTVKRGHGFWAIHFQAPSCVELDFLLPHVLPPK